MENNKFKLSAGQGHALEMAMNRPGNGKWNSNLVHELCQGDNLGFVCEMLRTGRRNIAVPAPTIVWKEIDDVIYLSVTSDGRNGLAWIETFDVLDINIRDEARLLLQHQLFQPTRGVTYNVAIIKDKFFCKKFAQKMKMKSSFERYGDNQWEHDLNHVRAEARVRGWKALHPEAMCLMREILTNGEIKKMGLGSFTGTHIPVPLDYVFPSGYILQVSRGSFGLSVSHITGHNTHGGWAFEVSESKE